MALLNLFEWLAVIVIALGVGLMLWAMRQRSGAQPDLAALDDDGRGLS